MNDTTVIDSVLTRVGRLERQNRRLKAAVLFLTIAGGAAAFMGAAAGDPAEVTTRHLRIVDEEGNLRASLASVGNCTMLGLFVPDDGGNGRTEANFVITPGNAYLTMHHTDKGERVDLGVNEKMGGYLTIKKVP